MSQETVAGGSERVSLEQEGPSHHNRGATQIKPRNLAEHSENSFTKERNGGSLRDSKRRGGGSPSPRCSQESTGREKGNGKKCQAEPGPY